MRLRDQTPKLVNEAELLTSPCQGRVTKILKDIEKNETQIIIQIRPWDMPGILFPISAEVTHTEQFEGSRLFRLNDSFEQDQLKYLNETIEFNSKNLQKTKLGVYPCVFSAKPNIWVKVGDRGRQGAYLGWMFLGGTIVITTNSSDKVAVEVGMKLTAGESIILVSKEGEL